MCIFERINQKKGEFFYACLTKTMPPPRAAIEKNQSSVCFASSLHKKKAVVCRFLNPDLAPRATPAHNRRHTGTKEKSDITTIKQQQQQQQQHAI